MITSINQLNDIFNAGIISDMTRYALIMWEQTHSECPSKDTQLRFRSFIADWLNNYYSHRPRGSMLDQLKRAINERIFGE